MTTVPAMTFPAFDNPKKFTLLAESLSIAEKKCNKLRQSNTIETNTAIDMNREAIDSSLRINNKHKNKMQKFRGKNSIFKRPADYPPRLSRFNNIPDHHKNPHKWTEYSLADVTNEQMSDKSNAQAAFDFLKVLKARKQISSQREETMEISQDTEPSVIKSKSNTISTIQFRKPISDSTSEKMPLVIRENCVKPIFKSSTIVLPEYVVGQKPKIKSYKKNSRKSTDQRRPQVTLAHLEPEPNEEKEE